MLRPKPDPQGQVRQKAERSAEVVFSKKRPPVRTVACQCRRDSKSHLVKTLSNRPNNASLTGG